MSVRESAYKWFQGGAVVGAVIGLFQCFTGSAGFFEGLFGYVSPAGFSGPY